MNLKHWGLGLFAIAGLGACQPVSDVSFVETANSWGIFSDRPIVIERSMVVVQLKSPPLAASGQMKDGKFLIKPELREAITAEQNAFLKEVAAISPQIEVVFRYQMVVNALALNLPQKYADQVKGLGQVLSFSSAGYTLISAPLNEGDPTPEELPLLRQRNSVKFIGAERLHHRKVKNAAGEEVPLDGTGIKVGVIDSGIDYTHAMFGGPGTEVAYKQVDLSGSTPYFPNHRVVGGYDFAGSDFDPRSPNLDLHIPSPDQNPLDESTHGTHVGGTIAGIGDGLKSYSGVAPGAQLYALKVFSKSATSSTLVLAAFEYAMDPNRDGDPADRLDILNLSLGANFGSNSGLYSIAIENLARAGVVTVASAGNSGDFTYVAGSPGVSTEALSVAASIDDSFHNIQFPTVAVTSGTLGKLIFPRVEGPLTKEIESLKQPLSGKLVDVGLADKPMTAEQAEKLKGNIALIARGVVAFKMKLDHVLAAGAIAALVTNNNDEPAFAMGGEGTVDIPGVMISKADGEKIREAMKTEDVTLDLFPKDVIEKPELVDTMTAFSSAGPRSVDSFIKPEITAPGANVISALAGKGTEVRKMSGTSMAGPHVAGAMALLKQAHPNLSVAELKNLMMGRTIRLKTSVARQGAGRIAVDRAVDSPLVANRPSLSLGRVQVLGRKGLSESFSVKSLSDKTVEYSVVLESRHAGLTLTNPSKIRLNAGSEAEVNLDLVIDPAKMKIDTEIMDGWIVLKDGDEDVYHLPILAVVRQLSNIQLGSLKVQASGIEDAAGATAELTLKNESPFAGEAMLFTLIGQDGRKANPTGSERAHEICDMQAVGYRIVDRLIQGTKTSMLQVAVKMFQPMTNFNYCEVTVLLDGDADGEADQELAMISLKNVDGLSTPQTEKNFASVLLDAKKMRQIRKTAEDEAKVSQKKIEIDYKPAVLDLLPYLPENQSTVKWVEAKVDLLKRSRLGDLSVKVASLQLDNSSDESDDFLGNGGKEWMKISLMPETQSYIGMPTSVNIDGKSTRTLRLKKGENTQPLMILLPDNMTVQSDGLTDRQMILAEPEFQFKQ